MENCFHTNFSEKNISMIKLFSSSCLKEKKVILVKSLKRRNPVIEPGLLNQEILNEISFLIWVEFPGSDDIFYCQPSLFVTVDVALMMPGHANVIYDVGNEGTMIIFSLLFCKKNGNFSNIILLFLSLFKTSNLYIELKFSVRSYNISLS